ncbi:MAG: amidohydrolase family protein [Lautropia sp.]
MIDVHHHILPQRYVDAVGAGPIGSQGSSGRVPAWSVEAALEGMDAAGIAVAITSISAPGFGVLAGQPAAALARWCNEFAARLGQDHSARFGMFTALPLPDLDASLQEAAYAFDQLHSDGVCLLSNYGGRYLGAPEFDALYQELDRRHAVVFVHPTSTAGMHLVGGLSASTLEFPFDTTRAVADLIFARVPARFPNIRWILSHAGGAIPYLSGRVEVLTTNNPKLREAIPDGFQAELRKFYFDCALSYNATTMDALRQEVGSTQLLFGSDYPFGPRGQMAGTAAGVAALPWSEDEKQRVRTANAAALFPRWRGLASGND